MRVVIVSSPGEPDSDHWSNAAAAELARVLLVGGVAVEWFRAAGSSAAAPPGALVREVSVVRAPLHRVLRAHQDAALEAVLAGTLRGAPAHAVVHVGTGAGGSPNVVWLADRMGSSTFAVVRAADLVCHRGTFVDRLGAPCTNLDDAALCSRCCSSGWLRRAPAAAFHDRWDHLLGGLAVAAAVFVPTPYDAERLAQVGLSSRVLVPTHDPSAVAARVLAGRSP